MKILTNKQVKKIIDNIIENEKINIDIGLYKTAFPRNRIIDNNLEIIDIVSGNKGIERLCDEIAKRYGVNNS